MRQIRSSFDFRRIQFDATDSLGLFDLSNTTVIAVLFEF